MKRIIEKIKGGDKKGKKVLIIAGVHGDELTPIYTLSYMLKNKLFNIDKVKSITVMNGINSSGIKSTTREISSNNTTDLNRMLSTESKVDMIG